VTVIEADRSPSLGQTRMGQTRLGGRFRLDERINVGDRISGACGASWETGGLSLWKATDELLSRPVTIYLLPAGRPVPPDLVAAVLAAAKVSDPRLATIYDTDFSADRPYIVAEWATGTHLEDLVFSGLPTPALAAAMIADAADALAVAHQAGRPHLRLMPRSLRWDNSTGLKITGLGLDAALCGTRPDEDPVLADTRALARMLYALLTGFWPGEPGDEANSLPPAPRYKGRVCTPRQVRAGVPAILDAITYQALRGHAPDAPARPLTPAALAMALRGVRRPSLRLVGPPGLADTELAGHELADHEAVGSFDPVRRTGPGSHAAQPWAERGQALTRESFSRRRARHARARGGLLHHTTLLRAV
jgi:hypothetical protein